MANQRCIIYVLRMLRGSTSQSGTLCIDYYVGRKEDSHRCQPYWQILILLKRQQWRGPRRNAWKTRTDALLLYCSWPRSSTSSLEQITVCKRNASGLPPNIYRTRSGSSTLLHGGKPSFKPYDTTSGTSSHGTNALKSLQSSNLDP